VPRQPVIGVRLSWTTAMQPGEDGGLEHSYPLGTGAGWALPIPLTRIYVTAPPEVGLQVEAPAIGDDRSGFYTPGILFRDKRQAYIYDYAQQKAHAFEQITTPEGHLWRGIYTQAKPRQDIRIRATLPVTLPAHYRLHAWSRWLYALAAVAALALWLLAWRYLPSRFVDVRYRWGSWTFWKDALYWLFVAPFASLAFLPFVLGAIATYLFTALNWMPLCLIISGPLALLPHLLTANRFARRGPGLPPPELEVDPEDRPKRLRYPFHGRAFFGFLVVVLVVNTLYVLLAAGVLRVMEAI